MADGTNSILRLHAILKELLHRDHTWTMRRVMADYLGVNEADTTAILRLYLDLHMLVERSKDELRAAGEKSNLSEAIPNDSQRAFA
jgi:hypothetical protein